jgi:hypothetical protein
MGKCCPLDHPGQSSFHQRLASAVKRLGLVVHGSIVEPKRKLLPELPAFLILIRRW